MSQTVAKRKRRQAKLDPRYRPSKANSNRLAFAKKKAERLGRSFGYQK